MKKNKILSLHLPFKMLMAVFLLFNAQLHAQDYSREELTSLANAYFEISPKQTATEKASKFNRIKSTVNSKFAKKAFVNIRHENQELPRLRSWEDGHPSSRLE